MLLNVNTRFLGSTLLLGALVSCGDEVSSGNPQDKDAGVIVAADAGEDGNQPASAERDASAQPTDLRDSGGPPLLSDGGKPTEPNSTPDSGSADGGTPPNRATFRSGSRIVARVSTDGQGAELFAAFYDTLLKQNCSFQTGLAGEDEYHCFRAGFSLPKYTDSDCERVWIALGSRGLDVGGVAA